MSKEDYTRRSSSLEFLHPHVRTSVINVLAACKDAGIPFEVFESYRSPERQAKLYAKRPRVTKARPWRSYHQYGLCVDMVLKIDGRWSWSTKGDCREWWKELHRIADRHCLQPISWEKPHLQLAGCPLKPLRQGDYPQGGDDPWVWNLNRTIDRWESKGRKGAPPYAEYDDDVSRPSTTACGLDD